MINTYERPEPLNRCLEALARQPGLSQAEVIVVDDGSGADFKAIERHWRSKLPLTYTKIRHAGRSAARNRGARAAAGRRLIFLGDDVLVRPGWLDRHLTSGHDDPRLAVLGPYPLKPPPGGEPASATYLRLADPMPWDQLRSAGEVGFAFFGTGNLSMDRQMFLDLGGFDERFTEYGWEDIDLGYRFHRAGGRLIFDPEARAVHAHPALSRADLWRREFAVGVTAYQFWAKWRHEDLRFMKFWADAPRPGPAWRRAVGRAVIELLERLAPGSPWLPRLYERLIYSYRHAGLAEGIRRYGPPPATSAEPQPLGSAS